MSALAEALVAAQRRALAATEKAYVAGFIEHADAVAELDAYGLTDPVDIGYLLAALDVIRLRGAALPSEMRGNGEPKPQARHKADRAEWERIVRDKRGPCRVCVLPSSNGSFWHQIELHHIVPRARGGDDVAENIAPLCRECHSRVTVGIQDAVSALARSLTDAEYAYVIEKLGEGGMERLFGVGRA